MRKINLIFLLSALLVSSCLKEEPLKLNNDGYTPRAMNDGLNTSSPDAQSIDIPTLKKAYELFYSNKLPLSKGLIVIRNGFIVSEAYSQNLSDISKIDNIQSCTKSITALLVGIAIQEGLITSIEDPIYKYLPEYFDNDNRKRKISIKNCLTLQAGLAFEGNKESAEMVNFNGSSLKFVLEKPMITDAGTTFLYSDLIPQLLTGILQKVTPNGVEQYAVQKIFKPLGITNYKWEKTHDGINIGAFSIFLNTRDLAKIGLLCENKGTYNSLALINESWIEASSRKQALVEDYGYGFYINSAGSYMMRGNGGQFVYINPAKRLIIAYTASPYTGPDLWGNTSELITLITTACK